MNQQTIQDIVQNVVNDINEYSEYELIQALSTLDDYYFNDDNSIVDDSVYDTFRSMIKNMFPNNTYFLGTGAQVRGGKVQLPYPMPSLDQIQIGEIRNWIIKNNLDNEDIIITDKMDGASASTFYDTFGNFQISYSRGNGIMGADTSRHLRKIKTVPKNITQSLGIRCEIEISEDNFKFLQTKVKSRSGEPYRNARNMVSGVMNAETNIDIVYDYLDVFAYSVFNSIFESKQQELEFFKSQGFNVPHYVVKKGKDLSDQWLASYINERREQNNFAIDGIVIDVNRGELRKQLDVDIDDGNPKSSIKYKVADASNYYEAVVDHVEWNISKNGFLKPRVVFNPFPLCGVTVTYTTGYNARFIINNNIGPGTICAVQRMGDVVPNIIKIVSSTSAQMPSEEWVWNDTQVDALITDSNNEEMRIQQLLDFCSSLDFPTLKEGSVRSLFEHNLTTPLDVIKLSMVDATLILGANGIKAYHGIQEKLTNVPLSDVMGSYPSFGRGIGKRKMKKLIEAVGEDFQQWNVNMIARVDGFDVKTAELVMKGVEDFTHFYNESKQYITYKGINEKQEGKLTGHKIVMTGFRDKELEKKVEELGGENQSTVSAKTTIVVASDPSSGSGKASKARELTNSGKANIQVMSIKQFKEFII